MPDIAAWQAFSGAGGGVIFGSTKIRGVNVADIDG